MPLVSATSQLTPDITIVIPLHRDGPVFRACLDACLSNQSAASFEVTVVSDQEVTGLPPEITFLTTGSNVDTSPAAKRDLALEHGVRAAAVAFLDDDAYPHADWLDRAVRVLTSPSIDGVGGPGITPPMS